MGAPSGAGGPDSDQATLERVTLRLINQISFLATSRSHTRSAAAFTGLDLPPSDLRLLELLSGRPATATSMIAQDLRIDLAQASRQAAQLEAAGHLVRSVDPTDRRRTLIELSAPTGELLDRWLLSWAGEYVEPLAAWEASDVADLSEWIALVRTRLAEALPHSPGTWAADRWEELDDGTRDSESRSFVVAMIGLVSWVSQSGGFGDLLESINSPINVLGLTTLRVIEHRGPMSVTEVAERLAVDPSQASKRLRQLTDARLLDRAVDGFDRRSNLIRVSRRGANFLAKIERVQLEGFEMLVEDVDRAQRERWTPLMEQYCESLLRRSPSWRDA